MNAGRRASFVWCGAASPLTFLTIASFVRLFASGHGGFDLWGFPVCAGILAAYAIYQSWNWASLATAPAFNPRARNVALIMQVLLFEWVLALGLLPLALSVTWTFFPGAITLSNLDLFLANCARAKFTVLYALIVFLGGLAARELAIQLGPVWRRHGNVKDALKAIPDWWVALLFLLIYGVGGGWLLLAIW